MQLLMRSWLSQWSGCKLHLSCTARPARRAHITRRAGPAPFEGSTMARHTGSEVNISMLQIVLLALAREAAKKQASPAAPASALPVPVPSGVVRPCHLTPSRCHPTLQHLQQLLQHLTVFMKVKWKVVEPAPAVKWCRVFI